MNSTKPITSAERRARIGALTFMAAASVAVIAFGLFDGYGAAVGAFGVDAATDAAAAPIGPERDRRLDVAQEQLKIALEFRGDDAQLWEALAATRYLQATGAEVRQISQPLLVASLEAARQAAAHAPRDPAPHARIAAALSLMPNADQRQAAAALETSYRLVAMREALAPLRADAAGRLWPLLSAQAQRAALVEACMANQAGAQLAPVFAAVSSDFACARNPDRHS